MILLTVSSTQRCHCGECASSEHEIIYALGCSGSDFREQVRIRIRDVLHLSHILVTVHHGFC